MSRETQRTQHAIFTINSGVDVDEAGNRITAASAFVGLELGYDTHVLPYGGRMVLDDVSARWLVVALVAAARRFEELAVDDPNVARLEVGLAGDHPMVRELAAEFEALRSHH